MRSPRELLAIPREQWTDEERAAAERLTATVREAVLPIIAGVNESARQATDQAMGKPYRDLVEKMMKDRDEATSALQPLSNRDLGAIFQPFDPQVEAIRDMSSGVDEVAARINSLIETQRASYDQLIDVAKLLGALDATIRSGNEAVQSGNESNGRLARVAIGVSIVATIIATVLGIIQVVRP